MFSLEGADNYTAFENHSSVSAWVSQLKQHPGERMMLIFKKHHKRVMIQESARLLLLLVIIKSITAKLCF